MNTASQNTKKQQSGANSEVGDTFGIQQSVPEIDKNGSNLAEREEIEGTPFTVIGNEIVGYFLALGKYRITEHQKTKNDAIRLLETRKWDIIINLMTATARIVLDEAVDEIRKNIIEISKELQ